MSKSDQKAIDKIASVAETKRRLKENMPTATSTHEWFADYENRLRVERAEKIGKKR